MKEEKIKYESPWLFDVTASIFAGRDREDEDDEDREDDSGRDSSDIGGGGFG